MENMWFWVADHDIESSAQSYVNVYAARSVLIESQGPSWVHGASSEHATLYQWQLSGAKDIYIGHIQSETPYFQSQIPALKPYKPGGKFFHDPTFSDCSSSPSSSDTCLKAWGIRIVYSQNVFLYGGGFYSFFKHYSDSCSKTFDCQDRIVDTSFSEKIYLFDIFTVGTKQAVSPQG